MIGRIALTAKLLDFALYLRDGFGKVDHIVTYQRNRGVIAAFAGSLIELGFESLQSMEYRFCVSVPIAFGIFGKEPAAALGLHDGRSDRLIIFLAQQRRRFPYARRGDKACGAVRNWPCIIIARCFRLRFMMCHG